LGLCASSVTTASSASAATETVRFMINSSSGF
jgi:hypothetical protein